MWVSRRTDYATRAILALSLEGGGPLKLEELARRTAVPQSVLEQVGSPRELYDDPASEFVMTFVGDAQHLGESLVRPHDIDLLDEPAEGAVEAMIVRVTLLGRDAKVELHDTSGAEIVVLMTRDHFDESGFWRGQTVWAQPLRERVFAESR